MYKIQSRTINYLVQFHTNNGETRYGSVKCYVKAKGDLHCINNVFEVLHVNMFFHEETLVPVRHILPVKEAQETILVKFSNVCCKVLKVDNCICLRPNKYEKHL